MHGCRLVCGLVFGLVAPCVPAASGIGAPGPHVAAPQGDGADPGPAPGALPIVNSYYGGRIFGFDVDQDGSTGVLSEAQTLPGGEVLAAVETFDQHTGQILAVVARSRTRDDYLTLGIVGDSVGLIEYEHELGFLQLERLFYVMDPVSSNRFTRPWTPPIDADHIIEEVSRGQGGGEAAVYAYDNGTRFRPQVFRSDIAANTFGPLIALTDMNFGTGLVPVLAYNETTRQAVLGIQTLGNPFVAPKIALVDLDNGDTIVFTGVGLGDVNGIAVDPLANIACTTTEIDFSVQFYDLASRTGVSQLLPGATNQFHSGADVEFDPLHRMFLVAQPNSSTAPGTSSIHVYDEQGGLVESIDGLHFSNAGSVVAVHIALHPALRIGFVDGPDPEVTQIQAFRY